ncbi:DNA cytosine methyltransferase [Vibrio cholerae]|uniref:DNA cytosine methyltransferase n=1 Tax=Vibrio cholerae TaxID=666 RepID=UPI0011D47449|nr:DNA cytosine methyltransferase [Vibrio cholerae]TXZ23711.1 DNA cytosine methyltransferase [Vibrio cholerae]GIA46627.1 DNA-cytosine methyltransferase [Vibrio cholerae]
MVITDSFLDNVLNDQHFNKNFFEQQDKIASLTHFLHSKQVEFSEHFKEDAVSFLKSVLSWKYPEKEISDDVVQDVLNMMSNSSEMSCPFPTPNNSAFTFIDLFAGIGGFRLALQNLGGECVFSSEWDQYSKKTYKANFGKLPFGDITLSETKAAIPHSFDFLCAGFPCQAFSIAGKRGGFEDTRGTLFFDVAEIIKRHKPKAFLLENVKGLTNHDKGKTLDTILNVLREDLGYFVPEPQIINAKDFGVPQNRERIFIVGFRKDLNINLFNYPRPKNIKTSVADILEKKEVSVKYYLSTQYLSTLKNHKKRHEDKGNGFGYQILDNNGIANAVVCGGMGRERNLVLDHKLTNFIPVTKIKGVVNREGIRKMTPREWARLQGFPDEYKIIVSDAQAYKQFGNSVAIPAVQAIAKEILDLLGIACQ